MFIFKEHVSQKRLIFYRKKMKYWVFSLAYGFKLLILDKNILLRHFFCETKHFSLYKKLKRDFSWHTILLQHLNKIQTRYSFQQFYELTIKKPCFHSMDWQIKFSYISSDFWGCQFLGCELYENAVKATKRIQQEWIKYKTGLHIFSNATLTFNHIMGPLIMGSCPIEF